MVGPQRERRKKPIRHGTFIRELVTLRAALRWSIREKWITPQDEPQIIVPTAPPARDRWLTRIEARLLLDKAASGHIRLFILLALHTAGRRSALLELAWDQVDLKAKRTVLGRGRGNKRRAIVTLDFDLLPALKEARIGATCDAVVAFGDKAVDSVRTGFATTVCEAKLTGVKPRTRRHTAAARLVQGGILFEMVATYLGNTVAMVERVYGHHSPEHLATAATALTGTGLTGPPAPETPKKRRPRKKP